MIRYRRSLISKRCRLSVCQSVKFKKAVASALREIKDFGFWGEYGRKAET